MENILQQYIREQNVSADIAKTIINLSDKLRFEAHKNYCGVCGCVITEAEQLAIEATHFHMTCNKHRRFAVYYDLSEIRKREGIIFKPLNFI